MMQPTRMLPPYGYTAQAAPSAVWCGWTRFCSWPASPQGEDRWYLEALNIAARGREEAIYAQLKAQPPAGLSAAAPAVDLGNASEDAVADLVAALQQRVGVGGR